MIEYAQSYAVKFAEVANNSGGLAQYDMIHALCLLATTHSRQSNIDGITFASEPGTTYVAAKSVGYWAGWSMKSDGDDFLLNEVELASKVLLNGTRYIKVRDLRGLGIDVHFDTLTRDTVVNLQGKELVVTHGPKRVVINKALQKLRAFQGKTLVLETRVSTGKKGHTTPSGEFDAGPEKRTLRLSRKYDNAPMPWSVQVNGDVFMHGYRSVPKYPASHGCVRMPMWGGNAAKWMFNWIDLGTPIRIANEWGDIPTTEEWAEPVTKASTRYRRVTKHKKAVARHLKPATRHKKPSRRSHRAIQHRHR